MAMKPTMVQLPEDLVARLDRRARRQGVSRSSVIRAAVIHHLAADADDEIEAAYTAGYEHTPWGTPDEWGDVEAFHGELEAARRRGDY